MHLATYSVIRLYIFCQYVCSLGIEPTTFALPLSHRNTGTQLNHHLLWASLCLKQCTRAEFLRSFAGGLLEASRDAVLLDRVCFFISRQTDDDDQIISLWIITNISSWHTTAKDRNNWLLFINSWNIFFHITTAKQIIFVWLKGWISISQSRSYFTPQK